MKVIEFHKQIANFQRKAYKNHLQNHNNILNTSILIEFDYKQKISIGLSPRQVSSEYRNQQVRSCLGIILLFIII